LFANVVVFFLLCRAQGYTEALGKFEGDDFEPLFVKIDTAKSLLTVMIAQGLTVEFDLSSKSFVFEDTTDPTSIMLDYRGNIVLFKVLFHVVLFSTLEKKGAYAL
jgi:hypothetical protein